MNIKTLGKRALSTIDQYIHFEYAKAICSIPYFNNKTTRSRGAMRTFVGKGSPKDIYEELQTEFTKARADTSILSDEGLKKILTDANIGIDCSGFAYYVLNSECEERGKGSLDKNIHFVNCKGVFGKIRCSLRPVENCDVATLSHDKNSTRIEIKDVLPGDMITIVSKENTTDPDRDHILIIDQVEYQNFIPTKIHFSHAIAYPEDGIYGTGVRKGSIELSNTEDLFKDSIWSEDSRKNEDCRIYSRAKNSKTELRRLVVFR